MMKILFASENDKIGPHVFYQWYKTNFIDDSNIKYWPLYSEDIY